MGGSHAGGEMCMEGGGRAAAGRSGGGKKAAEHKAAKQPQRGLGVAQLEKIRLHNQMVAAFRSAGGLQEDAPPPPFAAPHADCFDTTDRRIAGVKPYYEGLLQYSSSRPAAAAATTTAPVFVAYEVRDCASSEQRQQQQHYSWMSSSYDSGGGSSEELDLELRL
ncbi:hypothetical protein GUJ93_ZPchr0008g13643 [Zizania palustris]|uniref:Uncharacterized protein n=1 Tax=Zizania palustris TaxID=103762 RepID=A0A8J5V0Z8_ZIZPA|nr:hypothetical protein GUJ93_ZPchr0008g13643 [Zizania palustris]